MLIITKQTKINPCVSVKLLCGLEASQGAVEEVLSSAASVNTDALDSSDELESEEGGGSETKVAHKKKNKRRMGAFSVDSLNAFIV